MKCLSKLIFALFLGSWINIAGATPLTGEAVVLDALGSTVFTTTITGDLDLADNTMTVEWTDLFFGFPVNTTVLELLGTGTYTRSDGGSGEITATVNPGQLGGYFELEWSLNTFRTFMVWDVVESADGGNYTTVDSDGDGIPGHALVAGPFVGITLIYDFTVGTPPPDIGVTINTDGGSIQECSETGGSAVSLTAAVNLIGGAELGSI